METHAQHTIQTILNRSVSPQLVECILSNPRDREAITQCRLRPVMLKGKLLYQL